MIKFVIKQSEDEIAEEVALEVISKIKKNPRFVLGLATGTSPVLTYKKIISLAKKEQVSFKNVQTFNLDEYVDLKIKEQSYHYFMYENLFKDLDFNPLNTHFPLEEDPLAYDRLINKTGGIDLQILGIGQNSHIGFNEPGTEFSSWTHVVTLTEKTRLDNARFFPSLNDVPTQAITMGLKTIMEAKEIVLIILGSKEEALRQLSSLKVNPLHPASILHNHPNIKLYTTKDLYQKAQSIK